MYLKEYLVKKERRLAELREKAIKDEMAIRDSGYNEGRKEGIEEGLKKGKKAEKKSIAQNMLEMKIDKKTISKVTGLTIDEIDNI